MIKEELEDQRLMFFWIFNIYFKKISLITIVIIVFYEVFMNLWMFSSHLKPFIGSFSEFGISHPDKLFTSEYIRYDHSISLSKLLIYLLFALANLCIVWHIPPRMTFSIINNISILLNNSNSTSSFFKNACHANPRADKKWAGSSSYISIHLFLKFPNTSAYFSF